MSLYIEESGTQGAPTIVFLHGSGTGRWMWTQQIADLADFHCINLDLPGHGKSLHDEWKSMADTAVQVAEVIRSRATHQRAFVVGLSLGGYIALELAAHHPAQVATAIVSSVTSAPFPNPGALKFQLNVISRLKRFRWFSWLFVKSMRVPADVTPVYVESFQTMSRTAFDRVGYEVLHYTLPAGIEQSSVPMLITAGGADAKPIVAAVTDLAARIPSAIGVIAPGLHHAWNGEDPALFSAMIRAVVTGVPLPPALQSITR